MNETTYIGIITDLGQQLTNKSIDAAEYKARMTEALEQKTQFEQALATYQQVLDSDPALKDLFEEARQKLEVDNGLQDQL